MNFKYTAKNASGQVLSGMREAKDKFALAHELRKEGLSILSATAEKKGWSSYWTQINESVISVPLKHKITFANNLSSMLTAGLSLSRALKILERQTSNKKLKKVSQEITHEVDSGGSLSGALEKESKIFSPVFSAMVKAGEQSGNLPGALKMVAEQMNKTYVIQRKVKGALLYPAVIIGIMILISILMLIFVVPTLTKTFASMHVALPWQTQLIIFVSSSLVNHFFIAILLIITSVAGAIWFFKTALGKRVGTFVALHAPVVGEIIKESNSAQMARTLSSLISSGVDMVQALETTKGVMQNELYKTVLDEAVAAVQKGQPLSSVFQAHENLYPILIGEMIEVGEETGDLAGMLLKTAIFYEEEVDAATKDMSTIIEPLLMLLIGGAVGFFAISIIQPIYSIGNSIS